MGGEGGMFCGFSREKMRLVDLTTCGTPMRSSMMRSPRATIANAPAVAGGTPRRPRTPIMANSCTPIPAGVIGTNASAVTSG